MSENEIDKQKKVIRDSIAQTLKRVPLQSKNWSYQRAVAFKDCAKKSESLINNSRATLERLADQRRVLEAFYQ